MPKSRGSFNTSRSTTPSESLAGAFTLEDLSRSRPMSAIPSEAPKEVTGEGPSESLGRYLSGRSIISPTSSFAERLNRAMNEGHDYIEIGLGTCGSVFELPGTEIAVKKGKDTKALWNDFKLTSAVYAAFRNVKNALQDSFPEHTIPKVPQCTTFLRPQTLAVKRFPVPHREPGAGIFMDRIPPLPEVIREHLINEYFDPETIDEAQNNEGNKACLVRVYLGEREPVKKLGEPKPDKIFYDSLRNFPLRLNMMEDLDINVQALADEIAIALAVIHWQAQVDAMDAEFVLGSSCNKPDEPRTWMPPDDEEEPYDVHVLDFATRSIHLWVLDFDKAKKIEPTKNAIHENLVPSFIGNDPYYPRPDIDYDLWVRFGNTYIKASRIILKRKGAKSSMLKLPQMFLDAVEAKIKEHENWDAEKDIVFGE
ncbi:MAG: hypothetical protein Q9223_001025 [Gallowayella weberi]